jgi:hypothetical protein
MGDVLAEDAPGADMQCVVVKNALEGAGSEEEGFG